MSLRVLASLSSERRGRHLFGEGQLAQGSAVRPPPPREKASRLQLLGERVGGMRPAPHPRALYPVAVHIHKHTYITINKYGNPDLSNAPKAVGIQASREIIRGVGE